VKEVKEWHELGLSEVMSIFDGFRRDQNIIKNDIWSLTKEAREYFRSNDAVVETLKRKMEKLEKMHLKGGEHNL